jgi:hypothetical protein
LDVSLPYISDFTMHLLSAGVTLDVIVFLLIK